MTLFEQTDRALALYANQFAGRSIVLDKFVYDILDKPLLNGGVFLAAYWWLWFETDESGVHAQRRNVVVALLAVIGVAGALKLLKVLLPFRTISGAPPGRSRPLAPQACCLVVIRPIYAAASPTYWQR